MTMAEDLENAGYHAVRHGTDPIHNIQILGERCSGTNYVNVLTRKNVECATSKVMGWKHGFVQATEIPSNTLLICSMRNSNSWIKSLFQKPWHATRDVQEASFSEFIRMPFETVVDHKKYFPQLNVGDPVPGDIDPTTGCACETPFALRAAKHASFLTLAEQNCNVVFVHFERVLTNPKAFITDLKRDFGVGTKFHLKRVKKRHGWRFNAHDGTRRDVEIGDVSKEDQAYLDAYAASDIERSLGYGGDAQAGYPPAKS